MDIAFIINALLLMIVLIMAGILAYRALMTRFSPKYALRREVKAHRSSLKYRMRADTKEARLERWANEHADDPFAKAFLTQKSALASRNHEKSDEFDCGTELRLRQQADDDYEERRLSREVQAEQLLEWSIANPATPEARRHLEEQLEKVARQVEHTESQVEHYKYMTQRREEESPEFIMYSTQLHEMEAKKASEQQLIQRIQSALDGSSPRSSTK